jgi:hypothetical protein
MACCTPVLSQRGHPTPSPRNRGQPIRRPRSPPRRRRDIERILIVQGEEPCRCLLEIWKLLELQQFECVASAVEEEDKNTQAR